MNHLGQWEGHAKAPKNIKLKDFLYDLNIKYGTELVILEHDKGLIQEKIHFKFSGNQKDIANLKLEFSSEICRIQNIQHKKNFYSDKCKVDSFSLDYSNGVLDIEVVASKNAKVQKLAEDIKNHFGIKYTISEKDNGFLKGKNVSIKVQGTDDEIQTFADMMNAFLDSKTELQLNKKNKPSF